jgi:hypothetical protein
MAIPSAIPTQLHFPHGLLIIGRIREDRALVKGDYHRPEEKLD